MKIQNSVDSTASGNTVTLTVLPAVPDLPSAEENIVESRSEIYSISNSSTVDISLEGKRRLAETQAKNSTAEGEKIMAQRLFNVSNSASIPATATRANAITMSQNFMQFLTTSDRNILSKAYQYAADNNIDPTKVDSLATDMAHYRVVSLTGGDFEKKDGEIWNTDSSPLFMKMSESDTALATKMLKSTAINNTTMDKDFLARELNPRGGGWDIGTNSGHAVDYEFLQKIIQITGPDSNELSNTASKEVVDISLDPRFAHALSMIQNQDKPLMPPAGYEPPEKTGNGNQIDDAPSPVDSVQKILDGNESDEELINKLTDSLGVKLKMNSSSSTLAVLLSFLHMRGESYDLKSLIARISDRNK